MVCEDAQEWYNSLVWRVDERSSSVLLCQVVVLNAMKPRRLSPRVILQISIWTLIVIVLAFILLYSFLLTYMNRHVLPSQKESSATVVRDNIPTNEYTHKLHKIKFKSKGSGNYKLHNKVNSKNENIVHFNHSEKSHRKVLWNSSDYYDVSSTRPQCSTAILTILITSSPDHFQQRAEIRKTWCNTSASAQPPGSWQCVFLIGHTTVLDVDKVIDHEANQFHDILRGTYMDSYRNLTLKVVNGLNWNSRFCPTNFTLKTDDDCFVNTVQLYLFLKHTNPVKSKLYVGNVYHILQKRKVIRNRDSKWAVSMDMYAPKYYPPYASGTGYVLTRDMVYELVQESQYIPPIPNEDAYIGIVVNSLGIQPVSSSRFTLFSVGLKLCNYLYVFVSHSVQPEDQSIHQGNMMRAAQKCQADNEGINTWS